MNSKWLLILVSILSIDSISRAQSTCPNTMACQVAAQVQNYGPYRRCSVGVTLFGHSFGLLGGRCPAFRIITPAHQECHGKHNPGTFCEYEHVLSVQRESCDCKFEDLIGSPGAGVLGGECDCQNDGNLGTVQDAQTTTCAR